MKQYCAEGTMGDQRKNRDLNIGPPRVYPAGRVRLLQSTIVPFSSCLHHCLHCDREQAHRSARIANLPRYTQGLAQVCTERIAPQASSVVSLEDSLFLNSELHCVLATRLDDARSQLNPTSLVRAVPTL